jgi:opacity protein-like surface antigen
VVVTRHIAHALSIGLLLSLVFTFSAQAQRAKENQTKSGSYFLLGGNVIDIDNLNDSLARQNYPNLSDRFLSIGVAGHTLKNGLMFGGEAHQLFGDSTTRDNRETSLSASYGFVNVGYAVYSSDNLDIYPLAGIGLGRLKLRILNKQSASFNDILAHPKRSAALTTRSILLNFALGLDYVVRSPQGQREKTSGLLLGLRVGYTFALSKGDWKEEGVDISDGPETGVTGPYICLALGSVN